jgi:hypothetical protein
MCCGGCVVVAWRLYLGKFNHVFFVCFCFFCLSLRALAVTCVCLPNLTLQTLYTNHF